MAGPNNPLGYFESNSLTDIYRYIYIYIYREREREREIDIDIDIDIYKIGLLIRGQPHSVNVYHSNITSLTKRLPGAL